MGVAVREKKSQRLSADQVMFLPPRMRVMHITTRERFGGWLAEALTEVGGMDVEIDEAVGSAAGLAGLREENYDVVLVSHLPGELDALELIAGYRTGGTQLPMLVLGTESDQEMVAPCFEAGADGYLCVHTATTRNLLWAVARGVERHRLLQENHRLLSAEQSRLRREHDEADRLLTHQRALVGGLELLRHAAQENGSFFPGSASTASEEMTDGDSPIFSANKSEESPAWLPGELLCHYRELLRTYVIMGSGNLSDDLHRLAELLISAGLSARRTLQLHLQTLEELVRGLGARSTRHVMTRADLLILEVVVHLAEGYRQRYEERIHPPQQLRLPGL